jgi:hypothetical protein
MAIPRMGKLTGVRVIRGIGTPSVGTSLINRFPTSTRHVGGSCETSSSPAPKSSAGGVTGTACDAGTGGAGASVPEGAVNSAGWLDSAGKPAGADSAEVNRMAGDSTPGASASTAAGSGCPVADSVSGSASRTGGRNGSRLTGGCSVIQGLSEQPHRCATTCTGVWTVFPHFAQRHARRTSLSIRNPGPFTRFGLS